MVGETIGNYRIIEQLGHGGMATVYRAVHLQLQVERAIKIIRPEFGSDDAFRARFLQEAQAIARLRHPNIVQLHDYGLEGDQPYMVMEFIEGEDLKSWLEQRGPVRPIDDVIPIMRQVASALDYAHERGIVHRDIKPANILLQKNGQAILADFGIAQMLETKVRLTQTGAMMGTPSYMAPEQVRSEPTTPATDIYSLGIVVYEMITGRVPFSADTPYAVLLKVAADPMPEPRQFAPHIPVGVQNAIMKATAREPLDRYATAAAFVGALENALAEGAAATVYDSHPDLAAPRAEKSPPLDDGRLHSLPKEPAKSDRSSGRWVLVLLLLIAACVVLSGIAGGAWFLLGREQPVAAVQPAATHTLAVETTAVVEPTQLPVVDAAAAAPTETAVPPDTTGAAGEASGASALLGEPFLLSDSEYQAGEPEALRDKDGTLHVTWLERDPVNAVDRIWHRAEDATGSWSEPLLLDDQGLVTAMKQSLGSDGYPCLFWGTGAGAQQRCYESGTWTEPQTATLNGRDWMPAANTLGEFTSTGLVNAGTLVLGDQQVSDDAALAYQPQFIIDSLGRYHAFWIRQGDPYSLVHRWSGDNGQTWNEAFTLSDPAMQSIQTDFAIAADQQGRVHLAFMLPGSERRVAYRAWEDGVWSETEFLEDPGAGLISLEMALDGTGRPALAWAELGMALTRRQADGTWSAPTIILNDIQATSLDSFKLSFAAADVLDLIWTDEGRIFSVQVGLP